MAAVAAEAVRAARSARSADGHAAPPAARDLGFDGTLRELREWCEPPTAVGGAEELAVERQRREAMLARLSRLEEFADAATQRFEALVAEHDALRRKHARLVKASRRARPPGAADEEPSS